MTNDEIKRKLLSLRHTETEFSVIMTGKESRKVNGLYKPATHEIILHNLNFKNDNSLIYTAIHEYAHHLINAENENNGIKGAGVSKVHDTKFWTTMDELLETAVEKGIYQRNHSKDIEEKIAAARKIDREIARLQKELGAILIELQKLAEENGERFEDIATHEIGMKQSTAKTSMKASSVPLDDIGQDVLNLISSKKISTAMLEEIKQAKTEGKSVEQIKSILQQKAENRDSPVEKLEKEKLRLEKTISSLNERLEYVKEVLAAA